MNLMKLTLGAALLSGTAMTALADSHAQELHFIMCGGEVRAADQAVVDQFVAENDGVTVNLEAVPWGTCQDKSLTLAAAGDPPSIAYMGSRTLRQLANNDLIVQANIDPATAYQPGVLNTVRNVPRLPLGTTCMQWQKVLLITRTSKALALRAKTLTTRCTNS